MGNGQVLLQETFFEGSINNPSHQSIAIENIKSGRPVVLMFRGTFGIFGNSGNKSFVDSVVEIKGGGRKGSPLASVFSAERLVTMLDDKQLQKSHWIMSPDEIRNRISTLCFIRVPIKKSAASQIPSAMLSYSNDGFPVLQNWFPHGLPVENIAKHIDFPAVTSVNYHGDPEIIEAKSITEFCKLTAIPVFLKDKDYPKTGVKGSYTIFSIHKNGVTAVREGNIPTKTFKYIFGVEIDESNATPPKHPQLEFPDQLFEGLTPQQARQAIIVYSEGRFARKVKDIRQSVTSVK